MIVCLYGYILITGLNAHFGILDLWKRFGQHEILFFYFNLIIIGKKSQLTFFLTFGHIPLFFFLCGPSPVPYGCVHIHV